MAGILTHEPESHGDGGMVTLRLSPQLARVVAGIRRGASYEEIAVEMQIGRRTVATYTERIAAKLENPEGLRPYLLVFEWSRRQAA